MGILEDCYFAAFPDGQVVIDDLIAEGDKVSFTGTTTYRLAGGKIVGAWWNYDLFGMLQQLGAIPAPAEPVAATA